MIINENYKLSNDVEIPKIGLGMWMIDNSNASKVVKEALEVGYRHIDTAQAYQNEAGIGLALQETKLNRQDIFITTKLDGNIKNYNDSVSAIEESLKKLKVDYIDLMLIHSPQPWDSFRDENATFYNENLEVWKALEEAYEDGKLRAIGVSNFEERDLKNLIENVNIPPMVNQVLAHITNVPKDVIEYSKSNNILVEAYSPIAHGAILNHPDVTKIANKYGVSTAQLSIRYTIQLGLLPLPKSTNKLHMQSNSELEFTISNEDMEILNNIPLIENYGKDQNMPVFKSQYKS